MLDIIEFAHDAGEFEAQAGKYFTREYEFVACVDERAIDGYIADIDAPASSTMKPQWFNISEIPYESMPADDAVWYPHVLARSTSCSRDGSVGLPLLKGAFGFMGRNIVMQHMYEETSALE